MSTPRISGSSTEPRRREPIRVGGWEITSLRVWNVAVVATVTATNEREQAEASDHSDGRKDRPQYGDDPGKASLKQIAKVLRALMQDRDLQYPLVIAIAENRPEYELWAADQDWHQGAFVLTHADEASDEVTDWLEKGATQRILDHAKRLRTRDVDYEKAYKALSQLGIVPPLEARAKHNASPHGETAEDEAPPEAPEEAVLRDPRKIEGTRKRLQAWADEHHNRARRLLEAHDD